MTTPTTTSGGEPRPCPGCGRAPVKHYWGGVYNVHCENYDGAPDTTGPHRMVGWSLLCMGEAIENWNDAVEAQSARDQQLPEPATGGGGQ